jgi:hypothetical protein
MPDIQRTTCVVSRVEAYKGFFDYEWQNQFMKAVRGTKIQDAGFDLTRNWEAVSNARSLPWLMVQCVEAAERKHIEEIDPLDRRKIRVLTEKLVSRMEARGEKMRPVFRGKLQEAIEEIDAEYCDTMSSVKTDVLDGRPDLWDALIEDNGFHSSLWSQERMCYGSLYYSYEWFLLKCVRIKRADADYRVRRAEDFKKDLREAFSATLAAACWSSRKIVIAREARNALAHNAGRLTERLRKQPHTFPIENGEIQVGATHTTDLYHLLKANAYDIAVAASAMPEFQ